MNDFDWHSLSKFTLIVPCAVFISLFFFFFFFPVFIIYLLPFSALNHWRTDITYSVIRYTFKNDTKYTENFNGKKNIMKYPSKMTEYIKKKIMFKKCNKTFVYIMTLWHWNLYFWNRHKVYIQIDYVYFLTVYLLPTEYDWIGIFQINSISVNFVAKNEAK